MALTVLFLTEIHFSEWHYRRFGVDVLKSRGVSVLVLDFTRWLVSDYYERYRGNIHQCPELVEVDGLGALNGVAAGIDGDPIVIFDNIGFSHHADQIRDTLFVLPNVIRASWNLGVLPQRSEGVFKGLYQQLASRTALHQRIINRTRRFFSSRNLCPYGLILLSGRLSAGGAFASVRHKVWAHAFDYDTYLDVERSAGNKAPELLHVLYLDEDIVGHPDLEHCGFRAFTTSERFYSSLNRGFDDIERIFGLPVVIAAHPKADSSALVQNLAGRHVVSGCTAELVRDASLVLGHASCSFNFPMIWRKPIMVLTSDDLERSRLAPYIAARAETVGLTPVNIDRPIVGKREHLLCIDETAYDRYFGDYIKAGDSADKSVWDLFVDYLEQHFA